MGWIVVGLFILWFIICNLPDNSHAFLNKSRVGTILVGSITALFLLFMAAMCTMGGGGWEARWG